MEVHAHELHKAPGHGWKHYVSEFLMLFIAVFCGFLAENIREHQVEKERAKEYIVSLYEDLKADTARLAHLIRYDDEKIVAFRGMESCYDTVVKNWKQTSCMGILVKYSKTNRSFNLTDRTLRQLANAGGFRLLQKEDADSLLHYESLFRQYQNFESTVFQGAQDNLRNTLNLMADFKVNAPLQNASSLEGTDTMGTRLRGPLLFVDDKTLLNKWFNELSLYLRVIVAQRNTLNGLKDRSTGLIEFYKKKYELD